MDAIFPYQLERILFSASNQYRFPIRMKSIPESQTDLLFSFSQICLFFADPDVFFHKGLDPYQSKKSLYILSAPKLTAIMHLLKYTQSYT